MNEIKTKLFWCVHHEDYFGPDNPNLIRLLNWIDLKDNAVLIGNPSNSSEKKHSSFYK